MSTTLSPSTRAARGVARRRRRFSTLGIDAATVMPTLLRPLASPRVAATGTLAAALLLCLLGPSLAAGRPDRGEPTARSGGGYENVGAAQRLARGAGYAADGDRAR